jgi:hypothetical protein
MDYRTAVLRVYCNQINSISHRCQGKFHRSTYYQDDYGDNCPQIAMP